MNDCVFCAIVDGGVPADVVVETDTVLAFRDTSPQAQVHVLVVPRAHHETLAQMAVVDAQGVADLLAAAGEVAAAEGVDGAGYRLVSNVGRDGGQQVPHVHLHVLGGEALGPLVAPRPG